MTYPASGSLIDKGINASLSTQITIKVGPTTIGAIQSATITQNREISVHEEIGTDGVVDSHPKNAAKINMRVERIVFDQLRLTEAFARGFINLQAQRIPFDIQILDRSEQFAVKNEVTNALSGSRNLTFGDRVSDIAGSFINQSTTRNSSEVFNALDQLVVVHTLHNCWFATYSPTWNANNFIISENADIRAERISTHRGGQSAVYGGLRGINYEHDDIERNIDRSGRPGRLVNNPVISDFRLFTV